MIEFALLFGLGFFACALACTLVAPVVHTRIVRFAEERLKATVPLSVQEVRAQTDAARAVFAAENARSSQALRRERDKAVDLMVRNEAMANEIRTLASRNADQAIHIDEMNAEAGDLRSSLRETELKVERLKAALRETEDDNTGKADDIRKLARQLDRVTDDLNAMKIDLAARDTEIENLKARLSAARHERETLRSGLKVETGRARESEIRLGRETRKVAQLEARLAREMAASADRDNLLERRVADVDRLKAQVKDMTGELREATRALRAAGVQPAHRRERKPAATAKRTPVFVPPAIDAAPLAHARETTMTPIDHKALTEETRNRATALAERLVHARNGAHDDAMREEVADIAASMVALSASNEGPASPIHSLLAAASPHRPGNRLNLANRARRIMAQE